MNCPKCESVVPDDADRCEQCGAEVAQEPGMAVDEAAVSPGADVEPAPFSEEEKRKADWGFLLDREFDRLYERFKKEEGPEREGPEPEEEKAREIHWGGFFRRASAFSIDLVVLSLLFLLLFYFSYVGYRVGLAAHDRSIFDDPLSFMNVAFFGHLFLAAVYFTLFHGMDGRTIGKWILGLRVVGRDQQPITYAQAFIRMIGYMLSAFFGLGFIWILLNREKRGWHDLLARTWVIRE